MSRTTRLYVVVDDAEAHTVRRAAQAEGLSVSAWLRRLALAAAKART